MKQKTYLLTISILLLIGVKAQKTTDDARKMTDQASATLTKEKKDLKDGWTKDGTINIAVSEAGQNDYWTAVKGGTQSAFGAKGILDYNFDRKKGKTNWLNSFRARYGGASSTATGNIFTKNDDYLNFSSIYGKEFLKKWSYAGYFSLESQFDTYFMTPGYIKLGPGILYKPNESFSALFSPAMLNLITKFAPPYKNVYAYGVDSGKTAALGLGAFVQVKFDKNLAKGINYKSVATVYSNYLNNPGNMVLDWSNLITLTVNKYIGATISFNARYNDFEISRLQTQHGIGVGLSYKL
jgi:hypothetical protein